MRLSLKAQVQKPSLVIVDIQPSYLSSISFDLPALCKFVESYQRILVLFNGPDLGYPETSTGLAYWYLEQGMDPAVLDRMTFLEKDYGGLRGAMRAGLDDDEIAEILQKMALGDERQNDDLEISFSALDLLELLPEWNGSDLVGGGRYECLHEIQIWAQAAESTLHPVDRFIY